MMQAVPERAEATGQELFKLKGAVATTAPSDYFSSPHSLFSSFGSAGDRLMSVRFCQAEHRHVMVKSLIAPFWNRIRFMIDADSA